MTTAKDVLQVASRQIGTKEIPPGRWNTKYTQWYGMVGPWCAMFVSYCLYQAKLPLKITTSKGFAYCPFGINWFKKQGRWHTSNPQVGDIVFFDWQRDGVSDHVGIVEKVLANGQVQTIEGNTGPTNNSNGGRVMRQTRPRSVISGFGRPPYNGRSSTEAVTKGCFQSWPGVYISLASPYMESSDIRDWQQCMNALGYALEVDGVYGEESDTACEEFQRKWNLEVDGVIGPESWDKVWTEYCKTKAPLQTPRTQSIGTSSGSLSIQSLTNGKTYNLNNPVPLFGTASNGITSVSIHSPIAKSDFPLGKVPVQNGTWKFAYQFQTGGDRKIVVDGLNATNQIISTVEVTIHLQAMDMNDMGPVRIISPTDKEIKNLESSITFNGIAQDQRITTIKLRSPFNDKVFILGNNIPVAQGRWTYQFRFSTGGERKIVADGLDAQGKIIDSAAIEINLKSSQSSINATSELRRVIGIERTTQSFRNKVIQIARQIQVDPNHLMAAMSFETGGTFSPAIQSPVSRATGLIQFMGPTARGLGTTTQALARMTAEQQLDFVKKYFWPYRGKLKTLEDVYMAILWPAAIGKGQRYILFRRPAVTYLQNKGLDRGGKGYVTVADAAEKVAKRFV